jgi:branched-chain amino acid transport system ATP-binding protein
MLSVRDLGIRFGGFWGVERVDLDVEPGEIRGIIGPNGSGKSTLFNLIVGQYAPTTGDILFEGQSVRRLSAEERARRGITIKFQITKVFEGLTSEQNLALGLVGPMSLRDANRTLRGETFRDEMEALLDLVGLTEKADMPASSLSHGEKQWLEIGMAFATKPKLMLLDEPTSGMGREETTKTAALIKKLRGDRTILVIEHDMEFVKSVSERITVLYRGNVLTEGTYDEIKNDERVVNAYLGKER